MVSPITSRSRNYVRSRASSVMEYVGRIERVSPMSYDEESLVATSGDKTVIYEGKMRIWEISGASSVNLGDADLDVQSTQISTPWDAPQARKNDEIVITDAPSWDEGMTNRRFQIQSFAQAGELRATRRYSVTAIL